MPRECKHPRAQPSTVLPGMACPDCGAVYQVRGHRAPRADRASTVIVAVRLTQAERDEWQRAAGDRPLSDWIRERCRVGERAEEKP